MSRIWGECVGCDDVEREHDPISVRRGEKIRDGSDHRILDERFADRVSRGLEKREAHPPADEHEIHLRKQTFYHPKLVGNFCSPHDDDVWPACVVQEAVERQDLGLKQASRCRGQPLGNSNIRCVCSMCRPEGVVHEYICQCCESIRKSRVVDGFTFFEPGVLKDDHCALRRRFDRGPNLGTDGSLDENRLEAAKLAKLVCDRPHRQGWILAIRSTQMTRHDHATCLRSEFLDRLEACGHAERIRDDPIVERYVEI